LFTPELSIKVKDANKKYMELDIGCIMDGKLFIGEAKSGNTLQAEVSALKCATKYRDLALNLGASGVVFSTTEPNWNEASRKAMKDAFEDYLQFRIIKFTEATL
jgi:hypothetical protein